MKFIGIIIILLVNFSCKKETAQSPNNSANSSYGGGCMAPPYYPPLTINMLTPTEFDSYYIGDTIFIKGYTVGGGILLKGLQITKLSNDSIIFSYSGSTYPVQVVDSSFIVNNASVDTLRIRIWFEQVTGSASGCETYFNFWSATKKVKINH